ncbi:putative exopolysaccharide biosynthesis protein [Catenovulum agarivorans DS-2]|uniref:non-specific protein-tyrosine kinase n=1 Tax=Catenovulum agarivorans DS-2 TaxID=1328313 RepID=W7QNC3_9ALTE|nr:polysaccharide biosynthesis tyrosine autokinase [Catenovulum agarivorans]EWH09408.1 putative exopolysaccharide biosynthesis protein [Catenovulum agarivorans DS-2]
MDMQKLEISPSEPIINLKAYTRAVLKNKWWISLVVLTITVLSAHYIAGLPPQYQATTSLLIKPEKDKAISIDDVYILDASKKEYLLTQFEILRSKAIAEEVIDQLDLANDPEFQLNGGGVLSQLKTTFRPLLPAANKKDELTEAQLTQAKKAKLIENFQKRISITPVNNTHVVKISFKSKSAALSAKIANKIADVFIQQQISKQLEVTDNAIVWLKDRLNQLRQDLDNSEFKLQNFRQNENLLDIEGVKSIAADELESLTASYLKAQEKRLSIESTALLVSTSSRDNIEATGSLAEISNHPVIREVKRAEIDAEKNLTLLAQRYGPKHPKIIAANAQLNALRDKLAIEIVKLSQGIEKDLTTAKENEKQLYQQLEKAKQNFQLISNKELSYLKLQHEVEANRKLYDIFLARLKETDIASDFNAGLVQVLDPAEVPLLPSSPNKMLYVGISAIATLILSIMVVITKQAINQQIKTPEEAETALSQKLLCFTPRLKSKYRTSKPGSWFTNSKCRAFAESIRSLRTGIALYNVDQQPKTIAVTSAIQGEGKSSIALNLALAYAPMGKTLLLEADLRRPSLSSALDLKDLNSGLSDVLATNCSIDQAIIRHCDSKLDVLLAGYIAPNPLELLSSNKFKSLLDELATRYDKIVIDTPPVLPVSDSLVLAQLVDSVVYVLRADSSKLNVVNKGLGRLNDADVQIAGVVLNEVNMKNSFFERHYSYTSYEAYPTKVAKA